MRPLTVKIIILISVLALLGLAFTQILWIREGIKLAEKQFNHRADNALTDVVGELRNSTPIAVTDSFNTTKGILEIIDTSFVNMLVKKYVGYHRLNDHYFFGIAKTSNDSFIYRSAGFHAGKPSIEPFKACLSGIYKAEYYHLALYFPDKNKTVLSGQLAWILATLLFIAIIVSGVALIVITYLRQKKLAEMKNDFINNVTHEFKTPVSTIGLASEVLMNSTKANPERVKSYARIIHAENERMRKHIERVLEIAQQDHQPIMLNIEKVDVHKMISSLVPNICMEKTESQVNVKYMLQAENPVINGDIMYVSGVITNLTENAIKYTRTKPQITIGTENYKSGILISFADNGIGISKDSMKYIFNKFYRAHTGNLHDVKGFGLGLYYARVMTEAHGGFINVSSELNKGSRFDVYFPNAAVL
jgi:two-component system phosphate regulon sensor histidine kinase PhoR